MERWQKRVAVVTGASAGIGACIVKDLLRAGMIVVGMARRKERVDELRATLPKELQPRLHSVRCDVSDAQSVDEAFDWVERELGGVDVLVNNAGLFVPGQILLMDYALQQKTLQTNIMGAVHCMQRAYKSMMARQFDGHLLVTNSVLGHAVFNTPQGYMPDLGIYPPTKFALTGMTEVVRQELRALGTKIKITSISPGLVDTDLVPDGHRVHAMLKPADVSQAVLYAIATSPNVQVHELILKPVGDFL